VDIVGISIEINLDVRARRASLSGVEIPNNSHVPMIARDQIRPYASAVILEHVGADAVLDLTELMKKLKTIKTRNRSGRTVEVVASGISSAAQVSSKRVGALEDMEGDIEIDGFVCRVTESASWATTDSPFIESTLDLVIVFRWGRLLAIHCDSGLVESLQRWLDKSPRPPFRRIPPGILNAALLTGEAKGLWLRGTHARRTTKADSKNISGRRLQDALSPLEDTSFAMGSARAELPAGEIYGTLSGTIGTTQRKSLVWISRTASFQEFRDILRDLLGLLETTIAAGASVDSPYPWLATEQQGLAEVTRAYEITTLSVDEIPRTPDWPEEALDAAALLERAVIEVRGEADTPSFVADVGLDGSFGGTIRCVLNDEDGDVRLVFGWEGNPTNERPVQMVLDALQFTDLVTIYYESGQAVSSGKVWSVAIRPFPFPNWEWNDFSGYDIRSEKPDAAAPQEIHDAIGMPGDTSLFSWVLKTYGAGGWLTCDDGAGEVSDFIKYDGNGAITLLHVKAAKSENPNRRVNVTSFETVVSQATKNLPYLNIENLIERLSTPSVSRPATWYNGERIDGRAELIEFLEVRPAQAPLRVVIIQPQMTKSRYELAFENADGSTEMIRLGLLETLLNAARGAVTGLGADLHVVGSR
jgi:hypothetical protein